MSVNKLEFLARFCWRGLVALWCGFDFFMRVPPLLEVHFLEKTAVDAFPAGLLVSREWAGELVRGPSECSVTHALRKNVGE